MHAVAGALDEARALRDDRARVIAGLPARYAEATAVRALKIRHDNVLGYFVEVEFCTPSAAWAKPLNATFIHRQTLAGQVRFTAELGALEAKYDAAERALGMELAAFDDLVAAVTAAAGTIKRAAEALHPSRRGKRARRGRRAQLCAS